MNPSTVNRKPATDFEIGDSVTYRLNVAGAGRAPRFATRGPVTVVELKHEEVAYVTGSIKDTGGGHHPGRVTHAKLSDSPCWVPIEFIDKV